MQTRSKGNQNLLRYLDNIHLLPRELREQRDRIQIEEENQVDMENTTPEGSNDGVPTIPRHQVRQPRYIGAGDAPNIHIQRTGITPPAIPTNNFEIKSGLISMIQGNKFHGLPSEDPLDHLDVFEKLCGLTKINGVSEDAFKLRLFPFSLGDKARIWEKHLSPGSITSWADCKTAFLAKFFSNSRTAKIRNEISGFVQRNSESFSEAWERYKHYQSQCPHHGFSTESLLSTLYRGVLPKYRMLLDTASNGSFLNKDVDDGWELVENLAQADGQYGEDYDRIVRSTADSDSASRKEIKALNEKLDRLLLVHQKQVNVVCEDELVQKGEENQVVEISFVQNQGRGYNGYNNYKQHPNISYRSTNIPNPQDQVYPTQPPHAQSTAYLPQQPEPQPEVLTLLQQLLQGQTATATEISKKIAEVHTKIDASHNDLNCKFETLNARLKYLESQQASSAVKTSGQLTGNATSNPTVHTIKSLTLRNGKELAPPAGNVVSTEDSVVQEGEDDQIKNRVANLIPNAELDIPTRTAEVRVASPSVQNPASLKDLRKSSILPPLKPQIPFLGRLKKDLAVKYRDLFDKQMKDVELKIPILDAFALIPQYKKFLKEAVKEKSKEVEGLAFETFECRALAQGRIVQEKLEDPGTFTLPCSLGHLTFKKSLCDLGASISLMPLTVAKRLGFYDYKSCKLSLVLADSTTRLPHGLLENLPIRIGNVEVPTDFVVLDMDEEPQDPLLLGRPFLASAGALIDVRRGTIELNCGKDLKMKFDINETKKRPTIEGQSFSIEGLDQLDIKPLKPPQVVLVRSGKASDYCRRAPMYEEVVDGKSLESLFACNETAQPPPKELCKLPTLDLGPHIILQPNGYVDGVMEYKVKSSKRPKPFAKVKQLLFPTKPKSDWSGPFSIKEVMPCGAITLVSKEGDDLPINGQKVMLYIAARTTSERTPPPLSEPP